MTPELSHSPEETGIKALARRAVKKLVSLPHTLHERARMHIDSASSLRESTWRKSLEESGQLRPNNYDQPGPWKELMSIGQLGMHVLSAQQLLEQDAEATDTQTPNAPLLRMVTGVLLKSILSSLQTTAELMEIDSRSSFERVCDATLRNVEAKLLADRTPHEDYVAASELYAQAAGRAVDTFNLAVVSAEL